MNHEEKALEILGIADVMSTAEGVKAINKILGEIWEDGYFQGHADSSEES